MRLFFVLVVFGLLAVPGRALAGCSKDTDCKGDRICVEEACVDPPAAPSPPAEAVAPGAGRSLTLDPVDLRFASQRRGAAQRGLGGTWALFGFSAAATAGFAGTVGPGFNDAFDDAPVHFSIYGVGLILFAATGPVASLGGAEARRGLERLGVEDAGLRFRHAGWGLYGTSMGLGAASLAGVASYVLANSLCDGGNEPNCPQREDQASAVATGAFVSFALSTCVTSLLSTAFFQADTIANRRLLIDAIDDGKAGRLGLRFEGLAPWFDPTGDGPSGGLAVQARF